MLSGKRAFKIMLAGFAVVLFAACGNEHTEQDVIIGEDQNGSVTQDTTPPVITLNGDANMTINQGEAYIEPGATASDKRDGNVDVEISGTVDTSRVGSYTLTYTATDSAGNEAEATRTVSVTISTLQLESLNLEINVSTLNLGEQASLSVTGNYKDNTAKDLTEQAEWIISPSGSVEINGTVLTPLKDTNVTLQAKVGTIVSNTLKLDIYWEVNGHRLPPEPDPAVNNSTLLGIDSNNNGVRDDVERWIYKRYKDEHPIMIPLKMQEARAFRYIIQDPSEAKERDKEYINAQHCFWAFCSKWANSFGRKPLVLKTSETEIKEFREREEIQFNTTQRARAYGEYNQNLSGGVYGFKLPDESWIEGCDFNATPFLEMSEKL